LFIFVPNLRSRKTQVKHLIASVCLCKDQPSNSRRYR